MSTSKTMRLSDDAINFIESFKGNNFTDKFEDMVRKLRDELPMHEKRLSDLKTEIDKCNKKLIMAQKNMRGIDMINGAFDRLKSDMASASSCIVDFVDRNKL